MSGFNKAVEHRRSKLGNSTLFFDSRKNAGTRGEDGPLLLTQRGDPMAASWVSYNGTQPRVRCGGWGPTVLGTAGSQAEDRDNLLAVKDVGKPRFRAAPLPVASGQADTGQRESGYIPV